MGKVKKICGVVLLSSMMLAFLTPIKALTNYKTRDWKTVMPESECVADESDCTGYNAGSTKQVEKTNKTEIKSNSYTGNKETDANKWIGMKVGPYVEGGNTTIDNGINEELKIELGTDIIKPQEFFEVSFSLKNKEGNYVNELNVFTENVGDSIYVGIQGIQTTGGHFIGDPIAKISEHDVYTYSWKLNEHDNKSYVTFVVKNSKGEEIGNSGELEINENFKGNEVKQIGTDVQSNEVSVRWIWLCNIQVANGLTVYSNPELTVTPKLNGNNVTVNENAVDVLKESLLTTKDEILKKLLEDHDVTIELESTKVDEKSLNEEDIKKFESVIEGATITDYFNIDIVVKADGESNHKLTELVKPIELSVKLPENIQTVKEGYSRTYYILRQHGDKVEKLDANLTSDGSSLTFASDKFSTYTIAYVDEAIVNNPQTIDSIITYFIIGGLSLITVVGIVCFNKKRLFN